MRAFVFAAAVITVLMPVRQASSQTATAVNWSAAEFINVIMTDNKFVPDHLTLRHGVAYALHLENHGKDLHEFTAPEFFAGSVLRDSGQLANKGQEVVLQPGTAADVDLMPLNPGTYKLICADHDWDGMVGEITVE